MADNDSSQPLIEKKPLRRSTRTASIDTSASEVPAFTPRRNTTKSSEGEDEPASKKSARANPPIVEEAPVPTLRRSSRIAKSEDESDSELQPLKSKPSARKPKLDTIAEEVKVVEKPKKSAQKPKVIFEEEEEAAAIPSKTPAKVTASTKTPKTKKVEEPVVVSKRRTRSNSVMEELEVLPDAPRTASKKKSVVKVEEKPINEVVSTLLEEVLAEERLDSHHPVAAEMNQEVVSQEPEREEASQPIPEAKVVSSKKKAKAVEETEVEPVSAQKSKANEERATTTPKPSAKKVKVDVIVEEQSTQSQDVVEQVVSKPSAKKAKADVMPVEQEPKSTRKTRKDAEGVVVSKPSAKKAKTEEAVEEEFIKETPTKKANPEEAVVETKKTPKPSAKKVKASVVVEQTPQSIAKKNGTKEDEEKMATIAVPKSSTKKSKASLSGEVATSTTPKSTTKKDFSKEDESKRTTLLHRWEGLEINLEGIEVIAVSADKRWMAVGLSSGEIALWEKSASGLQQRFVIPGAKSQCLRSLVWFQERLFGGNLNGTLFEVDFSRRIQITSEAEGGGGGIWALDTNGSVVISGCEDGRVRVYTPRSDGFGLEYVKSLSTGGGNSNARLLCLKMINDNSFVTGGMDGVIRKWDLSTKRVVDQMILPSRASVWCLDTYKDKLVCGDAEGRVSVWSCFGATPQTFCEHQADVLSVAFANKGRAVFAGGVDSKVCLFRSLPDEAGGDSNFVFVSSARLHSHDIRSVKVLDDLLVSGGVDGQVCSYAVKSFERQMGKRETMFRQDTLVWKGPNSLYLVMHTYHLELWQVSPEQQTKLVQISFGDEFTIRCAGISMDLIACIVNNEVHLFRFNVEEMTVSRVDISHSGMALSLVFSESTSVLLVSTTDGVFVFNGEELIHSLPVTHTLFDLCVSQDGQWFAGITSPVWTEPEAIEVFNLDLMRHHESFPSKVMGSTSHACMQFSPDSTQLMVARLDGSVHGFNIEQRALAHSSASVVDRILGMTFNPLEPGAIVVWGANTVSVVRPDQLKPRFKRNLNSLVYAHFVDGDCLLLIEVSPNKNHLPDVLERDRFGT